MRLTDKIYLVGSGMLGLGLSHSLDCHVYLVHGQTEMALIDAGVGLEPERILENILADGLDVGKLKYVFLTHAHADHAGACRFWRESLDVTVSASPEAADFVRRGDENGISLGTAKAAGIYPPDYRFPECVVDRELREGDVCRVGDCELRVLETPGHCCGSLSYVMNAENKTYLFSGDSVFHGGKILMTNVWDCDYQQYVRTVKKLANLRVDALLPGHFCISLGGGQLHIEKAAESLRRMEILPNIL